MRQLPALSRAVPYALLFLTLCACSTSRDAAAPAAAATSDAAKGELNTLGTAASPDSFVLDTGDIVKVSVFQNPDLTTETRVDESGDITLPLIGAVAVRGLAPRSVESKVAGAFVQGHFLKEPQITVNVVQFRSQQVSVLGNVTKPGRYPLDIRYTLSDMLAVAGGVAPNGADTVVLSRVENGQAVNREIDLESMFVPGRNREGDIVLQPGDVIYVHRAPMFYVHGEVQRPGSFRVERDMTLRQAVAVAGGVTLRGTLRGLRIERRDDKGRLVNVRPDSLDERVHADDVIYVQESIF